MKKALFCLGFIFALSFNSKGEFYYNVCRTVLDNGGGNYNVIRNVDDHYDLGGVLIGQDVTIHCAGNGGDVCPQTIAPPPGGGGGGLDDLPNNVLWYCEQLFGDLCDGQNDNLFPTTLGVLGSDNIVYYVTASITEIEGGKKYNLLIHAN